MKENRLKKNMLYMHIHLLHSIFVNLNSRKKQIRLHINKKIYRDVDINYFNLY